MSVIIIVTPLLLLLLLPTLSQPYRFIIETRILGRSCKRCWSSGLGEKIKKEKIEVNGSRGSARQLVSWVK